MVGKRIAVSALVDMAERLRILLKLLRAVYMTVGVVPCKCSRKIPKNLLN